MNVQYQRHLALGIAVTVALTCVLLLRDLMPEPPAVIGTVPTGASFNLAIARFEDVREAGIVAANVQSVGLPAFTRTLHTGGQVIVGPYVSIDEAEAAQRLLVRRGFDHARMLVDESIRRTPGVEIVVSHRPGPFGPGDLGVVVVAAAGRLALVLEMPTEPRQVVTRRATGSFVEVDAGPVADTVSYQEWNAPDGVNLINQVWIGPGADGLVRTRVSTPALTQHNVRVVGRRVYIDFWAANSRGDRPVATPTQLPAVEDDEDDDEQPAGDPQEEYRDAMSPIVARVDEIEPFLMSAIESQAPEVLAAISKTLRSVQEWIGTIDAPNESASTHTALVEAINLVTQAADPTFEGDRARQARQALARFDATAATLRPPSSPAGQP